MIDLTSDARPSIPVGRPLAPSSHPLARLRKCALAPVRSDRMLGSLRATPPSRSTARFYFALALGLSIAALPRVLPFQTPFPLLTIESLAFWALLPAYALAVVALVRGHRRIAGWLAMIALVHLAWSCEWIGRGTADPGAPPLVRVLDANLLAPRPSEALAREVLGADADVLALQEVSDEWLALLDDEGAREAYPYRIVESHPMSRDYFGIAILSRLPLDDARIEHVPGYDFAPIARADVIVHGRRVRVYSIHTGPPAAAEWAVVYERQMDWLDARLREDLARTDVLVATGDFNASPFAFAHRRFRALGLTEAHEAVGRGMTTTWPNGVFSMPPMRLDHAYVHGARIRGVRELPSHTSDHSPLVIDLGA
jgi:endonuclease/exonuclease/phosphatase (EEP) superfamily protein YafD